jgi:energy-coupling factor transporter ATP-binding protein EcfA2
VSNAADAILEFRDVSFGYRDQAVLEHLSFSVNRGEFVAIVGPNGTGKSTTLRLADGLLAPNQGGVVTCGHATETTRTSELARQVGFLFQNPDRQISQNTVREEVAFGLKALYGKKDARVASRTEEVLELLHLNGDVDPFTLAKGQRQAVALAGLIAVDPELLLLDEPTTGFDYAECQEMMEHIRHMNEAGTTVVMVCHDMELVLQYASRVIVLAKGHVLVQGTPREVFSQPGLLAQASLLPPQICALSQELGRDFPSLAGLFTIDEMADALVKMKGIS